MNIFQLEERIKQNPDSPLITRLAAQYLIRGKISDAFDLLLKCIKLFPDYSTAYVILARCYASKKRYAEAILCSKKTFSLQPDSLILKNLITSWEKQANVNIDVEDSTILPDIETLKSILFNQFEYAEPQSDEKFAKSDIEIQEDHTESKLYSIEPEILTEAQEEVSQNYNEGKDQSVIEFIDENAESIPQEIEAIGKIIEFDNVELQTEPANGLVVGVIENQSTEETFISKDYNKPPTDIESLTQEAKDNNSDVQQNVLQDQNDQVVQQAETHLQTLTEDILVDKVGLPETVDFESTKIITDQSEKNINIREIKEGENLTKSDEHITKIFETAQGTKRKETESLQGGLSDEPVPELPQIVSATLAEIYVRQGEFNEAIKTYKALIKLRPKQKEIFEKKIEELEKYLRSSQ